MARFYKTSSADFIDYLQEPESSGAAGATDVSSAFADVKAIPQDRELLSNILSGYEEEINAMTQELQANPRGMRALEPRIANLRQRMAADRQTGPLKAIEDRYNQDVANQKGILENLESDPVLAAKAMEDYRANIPPLNFDPQTKMYNQINPMEVAKPLTQEDWTKWTTSRAGIVENTLLQELSNVEELDKYTKLHTRGELEGVLKKRATEIFATAITPDMIKAEEQRRRYYGLAGDPETNFIDSQGRLNLNTTIGRLLNSAVESVTRESLKNWRTVDEDEGRVEAMRSRMANQPASWWSDKLSAVWDNRGTDMARSRSTAVAREISSMLQGATTEDGYVVENVEINASTGEPEVFLRLTPPKPEIDAFLPQDVKDRLLSDWRASIRTKKVPLNIEFLPQLGFSPQFAGQIGVYSQSKPNYSRTGERFEARRPTVEEQRRAAGEQPRRAREGEPDEMIGPRQPPADGQGSRRQVDWNEDFQ
jgi:hypothetical protein